MNTCTVKNRNLYLKNGNSLFYYTIAKTEFLSIRLNCKKSNINKAYQLYDH